MPIILRKAKPTLAKLPPQKPVLFDVVRDHVPLAVEPAGEHTEHYLERHGVVTSGAHITGRHALGGPTDVGREPESDSRDAHYGCEPRPLARAPEQRKRVACL